MKRRETRETRKTGSSPPVALKRLEHKSLKKKQRE